MAINTWTDVVLCTDANCVDEESRVAKWNNGESLATWITLAKDKIGERLRHMLRQQTVDMDLAVDDDILDYIYSYEPIRTAAVYMTIHLLCKNSTVNPGDLYDMKQRDYLALFDDEWKRAVEMLHLDTDDSGIIDDGEQYNINRNVKARRGG